MEGRSNAKIIRNLYALAFDCLCFAKAIQHDIAAGYGKRLCDADATCRSRYDCSFSL
jgi:hypothetical protein